MECLNCRTGVMQKPDNGHPGYVECPNCGAIELTYKPQDYQADLHRLPLQYNEDGTPKVQIVGAFGGYGSGKSKASLTEVVLRALENPNGTGLLTAPTLGQLKKTTLKTFFQEVCPPPLIESYNKTEGEIILINGFTFYTIPSDDEDKLRSINAGICHMEEASGIKRSIYDQVLTRMRDPFVYNKMFMVCSNPDLGWIKEVFADNIHKKDEKHPEHEDYNPQIETFIWATKLNKHLPPDFIEMNSKGKPDWWKKRYLEGSFDHSEGMVYPQVADTFKYSFDIPKDWERFVTLDHGLRNPTAVYFHAIDPKNGVVYTYDEYYKPNTLVPEHAKAIKPKIEEIPMGRLRFMVADPSIGNKTDPINGKSVQALYQEYGLFFQSGNNAIDAGILRVNSYISRGKWVIFQDKCPHLCKEIINYKFPELSMDKSDKNLDERPVKANDHACDSIRYGFMRLPEDPEMLKTVAFSPGKRYNKHESEWNWYDSDEDQDDNEHYGKEGWLSYV